MSTDLKSAILKRNAQKARAEGDIYAFIAAHLDAAGSEYFAEVAAKVAVEVQKAIKEAASKLKPDKGEKGDTIRGPRGFEGPEGPQGRPGKDGKNGIGIQGKQGPAGKDGKQGPAGKDGTEISNSALLKKINAVDGGLNIGTIKGLDALLKNLQRAVREKGGGERMRKHGGGMTLAAGSNITLVRNPNGTWTVSSTGGGGGSNIATEVVTAVNSGSNVTIDLTQLAHAYTGVLLVAKNGQILISNGNANLPGSSWSQSGSVITVYNADSTEGYQIQYTYA